MLLNYLKSTYRNLKKNKTYSLINILGLTLGLTICLLLLFYVHYEKSYDSLHKNADRIYRLRYERTAGIGDAVRFASCTPPVTVTRTLSTMAPFLWAKRTAMSLPSRLSSQAVPPPLVAPLLSTTFSPTV